MTSLHGIYGLAFPPIQNPGCAYALNHVQYAYQIPVVPSKYCWRTFTSGRVQHRKDAKAAKYALHCFQSKVSLVWKYGMEYGRKFWTEWNM